MSSKQNQDNNTQTELDSSVDELEQPANETDMAAANSDSTGNVDPDEESVELQLAIAQGKVKEYWDQIMRLRAEIENNRKRAERDVANAHKYAMKGFIESLLPIMDSMEMGQEATASENTSLESIREGNQLTLNMFRQVLEKHGLIHVDPVGEKFNPEQHQAISTVDDENVEANTVVSVMQKGFMLNDRLVRPAMVIVSK